MDISGLDVHVVTDDDVNHVVSGNFSHIIFAAIPIIINNSLHFDATVIAVTKLKNESSNRIRGVHIDCSNVQSRSSACPKPYFLFEPKIHTPARYQNLAILA